MRAPRGGPDRTGHATWSPWITAVTGLLLVPALICPAQAVRTGTREASAQSVGPFATGSGMRTAARHLHDTGPLVLAHRGGEADSPESTIAAFDHSLEAGADGILFDVRFTRDGVPVVLHDATLNRTTDCTGPVEAIAAIELRRCDAGAVDDDAYGFQHVPTLDEALDFIGSHSSTMQIYLHCKVVHDKAQAAAIVDAVRDHGLNTAPRTTFLADNTAFIDRISDAGAARVGIVFHDWDKDAALRSHYPVLLSWDVPVTPQDLALAAKNGQLLIASKDHPQSLDELTQLGVPAVAVDDLDRSLRKLGREESGYRAESLRPRQI